MLPCIRHGSPKPKRGEDDDADYYDTSESELEGTRVWQTLGKKKRGLEPGKLGKKKTHLHIYTHIHIGRYIQVSTMGRKPRV